MVSWSGLSVVLFRRLCFLNHLLRSSLVIALLWLTPCTVLERTHDCFDGLGGGGVLCLGGLFCLGGRFLLRLIMC